ncbi:ABC-type transport auxiliary lipoprotein family protein [Xylophilus sp. Leaf220]|uniref:ABC-type transport auxiliary lipoprotein family protein n=1 Tax=Xylophilus sp. Leaf220 TaxID=1735686 RepID=UPI0009EA3EDC|nr:ABC-type transport auxiliary lipoprotein family protein [Xylophilus sp. Leaf220]
MSRHTEFATKTIAGGRRRTPAGGTFCAALVAVALLAGCSALPDRPTRPLVYDFGPGEVQPRAQTRIAPQPPLALADVDSAGVVDTAAVMFRFTYADAQQLRPYAMARWSLAPSQLVRQRLRERLGRDRAVLNADDSAALQRTDGKLPHILRVQLEEFSQIFSAPTQSAGVVRLRVTLVDNRAEGERLLAQRVVLVSRPAPTADAPGGVQALAAATDAAADEIAAWLPQVQATP